MYVVEVLQLSVERGYSILFGVSLPKDLELVNSVL